MSDVEDPLSRPEPIRADGDGTAIYKLAMEEGLRRLAHQDAEVAIARTRVLQLMTVVTAATAFLAAAVLASSNGQRGPAFYIAASTATALYVGLLLVVWRALQPIKNWIVETSPAVIVQDYGDRTAHPAPASLAEAYRSLALHYQNYADLNEGSLAMLRKQLGRAVLLGGAQIACWVVAAWLVA